MPQRFDDRNPPFDRLTHDEVNQLRAALDIGYFSPGTVIIEREHASDQLYVIIKGSVEESQRELRCAGAGAWQGGESLPGRRGDALLPRSAERGACSHPAQRELRGVLLFGHLT
jgi:hypothetical protein